MLDLRPIVDSLAHIAPYPWSHKKDADGYWSVKDADGWEVCEVNMTRETGPLNGQAIALMPATIAALVAEVERLRGAIEAHRQNKTAPGPTSVNSDDRDLWAVLDA